MTTPTSTSNATPSASAPTPPTPTALRRTSISSLHSLSSNPPTTSIPIPTRLPKSPTSDFAELHQSLEQESEAVVNRLLREITLEQNRLHSSASSDAGGEAALGTVAAGSALGTGRNTPGVGLEVESVAATMGSDSTAGGRGGVGALFSGLGIDTRSGGLSRTASFGTRSHRSSHSRRSSINAPPSPIPIPTGGSYIEAGIAGIESPVYPPMLSRSSSHAGSVKDDATFYMIEAANVVRENEMLKVRIRELERQVRMLTGEGAPLKQEIVQNVPSGGLGLGENEVETEEEEGDGALTPTSSVMPEFDAMSVRSETFGRGGLGTPARVGTPTRVGTPGGDGSVRGR